MERLAYWVLCKYLSPYISNLNPDALKLSLWEGTIKLQNLSLRPEALTKELNLPLTIIAGVLGSLTINVRWRSLKSSPIQVEIDEVYLLTAPQEDKPYDPELEKKLERELKRKLLEEYAASLEQDKSGGSDDLFSSKSVFLLINNLQVKIGRIHIRYEDDGKASGKAPFAAGVTLTRLTALSADEGGRVTEKPSDSKTSARKALTMDSLSVYWDTRSDARHMLRGLPVEDIRTNLAGFFASARPSAYEYLIDPISASGRVAINKKIADAKGATPPQIEVDLTFTNLMLVLSLPQYHSVLHTVDHLSYVSLRHSFRHLRPLAPMNSLHHTKGAWWRYAFNAVLIDYRRRTHPWAWEVLKKRRDRRLAYVALYTRILQAQKPTKADEKALDEMEEALGASEIILYRRIARSRLAAAKSKSTAAATASGDKAAAASSSSSTSSWLGSWFRSSSTTAAAAAKPEPPEETGLDEAKKQFLALVDDSEEYETPTNAAYVATSVNAAIEKFGVQLYSDAARKDDSTTVAKVLAENTTLGLTQRPAGNAMALKMDMRRLGVWALTSKDVREIVRPDATLARNQSAFAFAFETNPIREGAIKPDAAVVVSLAPLEAVFYASSLQRITEFFVVPEEICLTDLKDAANAAMNDVSEQARAGLEFAIENRKSVDVSVDVRAPLVLVPQSDTDAPSDSWLVLDLGTFTLRSDLRAQSQEIVRQASLETLQDLIYDDYTLNVSGLHVLTAYKKDAWRDMRAQSTSVYHILPKTEAEIKLHRCLQADDAVLPQFKVEVVIPALQANLSDRKLAHVLKVAAMFQNAFAPDDSSEPGAPLRMKAIQRTNSFARPVEAHVADKAVIDTLAPLQEEEEDDEAAAKARQQQEQQQMESDSGGEEDEFFDADDGGHALSRNTSTSRFRSAVRAVAAAGTMNSAAQAARKKRLRLAKRQVVVGKFSVHHLALEMMMHIKDTDTEEHFLSLVLYNFAVDLRQRTFDTYLNVSLDALATTGWIPSKTYGHTVEEHYYIHSLPTPKDGAVPLTHKDIKRGLMMSFQPFLALQVTLCDRKSPLFRTAEFKRTEVSVVAKISTLSLNVNSDVICPHLDGLKRLIDAITRAEAEADALLAPELRKAALAEKAAKEAKEADAAAAAEAAEAAEADGDVDAEAAEGTGSGAGTAGALADAVNLMIDFHFQDLTIDLVSPKGRVAFFSMSGVSTMVTQTAAALVVDATLSSILIKDTSSATTVYPVILSVKEGDDLLRVSYTGYTDPKAPLPMVIKAETGNLRCVVLMRFVQEIMAFVEPVQKAVEQAFPSPRTPSTGDASAQSMLATTATMVTAPSARYGINVSVCAPTILFPTSSTSNELFVLDVGVLAARNEYLEWGVCTLNQIEVQFANFSLTRALRGETIDVVHEERPMMTWAKTVAQVRQRIECRDPSDPEVPFPLAVTAAVGETHIQLGRTDVASLVRAITENLAEGGISIVPRPTDASYNDAFDSVSVMSVPSTPRPGDEDSLSMLDESMSDAYLAQGLADLTESERRALSRSSSKLNDPVPDALGLQLTWRTLSLEVFNDEGVPAASARNPDASLLRAAVSHMSANYSLNPATAEETVATVSIGSVHIEDTRLISGRQNFFTDILHSKDFAGQDALQARDVPVLEARVALARTSIILVASKKDYNFAEHKARLNEAGRVLHLFEQIVPPKDQSVAVVEYQNAEEASAALAIMREAKIPDLTRVDYGPARSTNVTGSFNNCKLHLSANFGLDVMDFVESVLASTAVLSGSVTTTSSPSANSGGSTTGATGTASAPAAHGLSSTSSSSSYLANADEVRRSAGSPGAVMICSHCDTEHWSSEPQTTDCMSVLVRVNHPQVILVEDQFCETTRAILLDIVVNLEYQQSESTQVASVDLLDLTMVSYQHSNPASRLEVIPSTSISLMYRTVGDVVKINMFTYGIDLNISYLDIKSIFKILDALTKAQLERQKEEERARGVQACLWDQSAVPAGPVKKITQEQKRASEALASREALSVTAKAINITLLNSLNGRHSPLFVISVGARAEISNWSSAINGTLGLELAAATLEPRHSAWEPLILADRSDDKGLGRAWELDCTITSNTNTTVDPSTIHMLRESGSNYKTITIDKTPYIGGGPQNMLNEKNEFWFTNTKKKNWVIFDFGNVVKLQSMSYHTLRQPLHDPKHSILEVSESDCGPWRLATEITATAGSGVGRSPRFAESGRYWRWTITSRHSPRGACIRSIYFEQAAGGTSINLQAADRMELTLSSSGIGRLSKCISEWMQDYSAEQTHSEHQKLKEQQAQAKQQQQQQQGTHRIDNMTGLRVAITPSSSYDPAVARKWMLASFESKNVTLRPSKKSGKDAADAEPLIMDSEEDVPIVDLTVINPLRHDKPPPGFRVLRKNINALKRSSSSGTKSELYLCYRRGTDKPPITDVKIIHQNRNGLESGKRGVEELPLAGYERVGNDMNPNSGGRDTLLYVRRGNEAPIVGIAVTNLFTRETVPAGYVVVYKNINSGRPNSEFTAISVKRKEARASPAFDYVAHFRRYPISELDFVWCKSLKYEKKHHLLEGQPRGSDAKWEHLYHGVFYNINKDNGGDDIVLLNRRNPNLPPITDIRVVPQRTMFPGESGWETLDVNLNAGTGSSEKLFIQYRRDPGAAPIMDLDMFWGDKEKCPEGAYVVFSQLTYNCSGRPQWLTYKQGDLPPGALELVEARKTESAVFETPAGAAAATAASTLAAPDALLLDPLQVQMAEQPEALAPGVMRALHLLSDKDSVRYVSIEVEGYCPIEQINIDEIGEQIHVLRRSWAAKDVRVAVAVGVEDDIKVITLRSPLLVKNKLPIPVDLCIQQRRQDDKVLISLEPDMEYIPPLGFMDAFVPDEYIPVFRFWSEAEQVHFYSTNPLDVGDMATSFTMEYCMGYIFSTPRPGTVPLWISRPSDTQGGRYCIKTNREKQVRIDHPNEKPRTDAEMVQLGLHIAGHVYTDYHEGTVPIYRYWNGMKLDVLLTTEAEEVGVIDRRARGRHRYLYDGIECYFVEHPGFLRVRPATQTHAWSHELRNFYCSQSMPLQRFRAPTLSAHASADPYADSFQCDVSRPNPRHATHLHLEAPLLVVNGLPCTIRAGVVTNPSDIPRTFEVLKCRGEMHVHDKDIDRDLYLRIMIAAPRADGTVLPEWWSKPTRICAGSLRPDSKSETFLTMEWADPITKKQHILGLSLEYGNKYGSYGPKRINIYCPYLIHDKTTLGLQLMTTSSRSLGLYFPPRDPESGEEMPALFAPMTGAESTVAYTGLQGSEPFSLATAMDLAVVKTYMYRNEQSVGTSIPEDEPVANQLVVSWVYSTLPGLSKVFTINSIVLVRNHTEWPLDWGAIKPGEEDPKKWITLSPHQELPVNTSLGDEVWKLRWRGVSDWSAGCHIHDSLRSTTSTHVLKMMRQTDGALVSLQCETRTKHNRHVVTFLPPPHTAPVRVENRSSVDVSFRQKGSPREYLLKHGEKMNYAFDDPSLKSDVLCFSVVTPCRSQSDSTCISLHPQTPSEHQYTLVSGANKALAICVVYEADTKSHVYFIADSLEQVRILYGLSARPPEEDLVWDLALQLPAGFGLSFVENAGRSVQELAFLSLEGLEVTLAQTTRRFKMYAVLETMQLDFQAYDAIYPVVICKTLPPTPSQSRPLLTMTYVQKYGMIGFERSVDSIEYISVLLMPLTAKIDGTFGAKCIEFFESLVFAPTAEAEVVAEEETFYEKIELHPVKVTITLTHVGPIVEKASLFLRSISATVINLNNVNLQLASLIVPGDDTTGDKKGLLMTQTELVQTIAKGYEARFFTFLKQTGIVSGIASLQILGDPLNTLKTLAGGAKDLFYEPMQGVVRGPAEFGIGLGRGVKSLGASVVGGLTGASSKITGAVGQGMSVLTMDEEYQSEREKNLRNKPQGLADGLAVGGKQLAKGVAAGFKGLIMQPIKEGQKGGFIGGLLGVAKGVTGLVTKPASGIVDLFSSTLSGIESEVLGGKEAVRVRKPRYVKPSGLIVPFNTQKADGEFWLKTNKQLAEEFMDLVYISHCLEEMPNKSFRIVICLNKVVVVVVTSDLKNVKITQKLDSSKVTHCRQFADAVEIGLDDSSTIQIPFTSAQFAVTLIENLTELINMNKPKRKIGQASQCLFKQPTGGQGDAATPSKRDAMQLSLDSGREVITERVEVWENERAYFSSWSKKLLPGEREAWSSKDGAQGFVSLDDIRPYTRWEWASDWRVDMTGDVCDSDGWQYASNFTSSYSAKKGMFSNVRRRRWVRMQKGERRFHPVSATAKGNPSSSTA